MTSWDPIGTIPVSVRIYLVHSSLPLDYMQPNLEEEDSNDDLDSVFQD